MSKVLSKDLEAALEDWERDGAPFGLPGREAPGGTRTARLLDAIRAYRALPAAPTGPWVVAKTGAHKWQVMNPDDASGLCAPDQRTAEAFRDALNAAEQRLTEEA